MQNLKLYKTPEGFRGRSALVVQLWWIVQASLFAWSPQFMYGWRRFLLRLFGANIGQNVIVRPNVKVTYPWKVNIGDFSWIGDNVELYSLGEIEIGRNVVISQKCYLCTGSHDYQAEDFRIYAEKICVKDECWLATDVYVAPGITIHEGIVVGARSSVFKDLSKSGIYTGSPAKFVKER